MSAAEPPARHQPASLAPHPAAGADTPVLEAYDVEKRFGSVTALDGVDFLCRAGEVHAVLGENGAGKSTLMRVAAGLLAADSGELRFAGAPVHWRSAEQARAAGVAMVHQHFMLVPTMTVAENLTLARGVLGPVSRRRQREDASALAERFGLAIGDPDRRIEELSVGERQRVEIAKALLGPTRLLVLDEPTAVLTPGEVGRLFALLRELARGGAAVVIVTHKLHEVLAIADRVTVLRHGRVLGAGDATAFDADALAALMVGAAPGAGQAPRSSEAGRSRGEVAPQAVSTAASARAAARRAPVLVAQGLHARDDRGVLRLDGVSLSVAAGEILVIAGVEGNGQAELVDALAGVAAETLREYRGRVAVAGTEVTGAAIARRAGLAVVPPDRGREGLVAELAAWENLLLASDLLAAAAPQGVVGRRTALRRAEQSLAEFGVRPPDAMLAARAFSGGNQQRLLLAREIGRESPRAVVVANPSRGLDLAATSEVRARLRALAAAGAAVVVLSTDLDEVCELGARVAVLYRGRLLDPSAQPPDLAEIGRLMAGGEEAA